MILLSIFAPPENTNLTVSIIKSRLEPLRLGPLTRKDLLNLFINQFMQRFTPLLDYMETAFENEDGSFGLPQPEINSIIEEVAAKCLERECKVSGLVTIASLISVRSSSSCRGRC